MRRRFDPFRAHIQPSSIQACHSEALAKGGFLEKVWGRERILLLFDIIRGVTAERMELNDFKFYSQGTYLPSEFRARLEMLGAIHAGDIVVQEYIKKSLMWVEKYNDQENVIRWEKCKDGLFEPIVSTRRTYN